MGRKQTALFLLWKNQKLVFKRDVRQQAVFFLVERSLNVICLNESQMRGHGRKVVSLETGTKWGTMRPDGKRSYYGAEQPRIQT